jgi:hypothetical protein
MHLATSAQATETMSKGTTPSPYDLGDTSCTDCFNVTNTGIYYHRRLLIQTLLYSSETEAAESGSEASDEGSLSDHEDEGCVTEEGLASEPDTTLEGTNDEKCVEPEQTEGE